MLRAESRRVTGTRSTAASATANAPAAPRTINRTLPGVSGTLDGRGTTDATALRARPAPIDSRISHRIMPTIPINTAAFASSNA